MSTTAHKVATAAGAGVRGRRRPSVVKEIVYGMSLGLFTGYLWKLHHWSNQRRTREFYSLLDQGVITVVVDEPPPSPLPTVDEPPRPSPPLPAGDHED